MSKYRTHNCGELRMDDCGKVVKLSGWVNSRRDHGGVIFVDLRDRFGITQITFDSQKVQNIFSEADKVRSEDVIQIEGVVISRPENMKNAKLTTGDIEIEVNNFQVLSKSQSLPFEVEEIEGIDKADKVSEDLRLEYRFLDLRRKKLQSLLVLKDKYFQFLRQYFSQNGFLEVQTPILANSSPEGARDFLIPSRIYKGKFYALPQAPQQFKQLLMVGGVDKYFQIAPCFRDEDPRMDRSYGEFYQADMEMSFVEQEDVFTIMEPLFLDLVKHFSNKKVVSLGKDGRFLQIPWRTALEKYGSDKPDLRFGLEIRVITDLVENCGFSVFSEAIKKGGVVHALKVDKGAVLSRGDIDELTDLAKTKGAKGLAYIIVKENELQSPIVKFLGDDVAQKIVTFLDAKVGDIIFFGADDWLTVCKSLGAVRTECANQLSLKDNNLAAFCWIVDFPMYSYSDIKPGKIDFEHNPFSMPQGGMDSLNNNNPLEVLGYQYDVALNGFEVLSGAIRNHIPEIMYKAFEIAGYKSEEVDQRFGGMIKAFRFGVPPHGGCAIGVDRLLMVLADCDSIRDIYAFPKDGKGKDLMMGSPTEINEAQLAELHIKINRI